MTPHTQEVPQASVIRKRVRHCPRSAQHCAECWEEKYLNKTFHRWTVIENCGRINSVQFVRARCTCGAEMVRQLSKIVTGASRSCGCLKTDTDRMKLKHDYTGERIGRLTVLCQTEPRFRTREDGTPFGIRFRMWKVKCDCGKEAIIQTQTLRKQRASGIGSCGCWRKELNREERQKRTLPYFHYLARIKNSARNRNIKIEITYDDLMTIIPPSGVGECIYCGEQVIWLTYDRKTVQAQANHNRATGHNLDRLDNRGPYSIGNVVVCCGDCNRTRGDRFSHEEFLLIAPTIRAIKEARLLCLATV